MTGDTARTLWCLVLGDPKPFAVTSNNGTVDHIHQLVREERKHSVLRDIDPTDLVLWKLHEPERIEPYKTLAERIQSRGADPSQFALELEPTAEISDVFAQPLSRKPPYLDILVQLPPHAGFPTTIAYQDDKTMDAIVNEQLSQSRKIVGAYLRQPQYYKTWQSKSTDRVVREHISNLAIPEVSGRPNLLFHDMGANINPELISKVFSSTSKDIRLVNTSGSGKTRVLIDGLRKHWGFYLNWGSSRNMVGVQTIDLETFMDLKRQSSFTPILPLSTTSDSPELLRNIDVVRHLTWRFMVAHLLVLRVFLEEARALRRRGSLDIYRDYWVHLQLQSRSVRGDDVFGRVARALENASGNYLLNAAISATDWICESLLVDTLYVVLDEAQRAAKSYTDAFRSSSDPEAGRPVLRCLMDSIDDLTTRFRTIISGTGLSMKPVSEVLASRMAKPLLMPENINLIGAFDREEVQKAYVLKYLPPGYGHTPSGKMLLSRVWDWLRGRHRFTASFVEALLQNDFQSPHKLLNEYVHHLTGVNPSDSPDFAKGEPDINAELKAKLGLMAFENITNDPERAARFGEIICSWLLHQRYIPLPDEEKDWVEWGLARFIKDDGELSAIIDEPLIIFAAAKHLGSTSHSMVNRVTNSLGERSGKGDHFEDWLVVYFSRAFGQHVALCDVFHFGKNVPDWAQITGVELLAMSKGEGHKTSYAPDDTAGIPITLCCDARSAIETVSWFEKPDAVMCLPDIYFGPDIVFFVRIPGRGHVCIIVQSRYRSEARLDKRDQSNAISTLIPSAFYKHKNLTAQKWPKFRTRIMACVRRPDAIEDMAWFPDKGVPFFRVLASCPAENECHPPTASLNMNRAWRVMGQPGFMVDLISKEYGFRLKRKRLESEEAAEKHVKAESSATAVSQRKRRKKEKKMLNGHSRS